jgi:hypothetical protein
MRIDHALIPAEKIERKLDEHDCALPERHGYAIEGVLREHRISPDGRRDDMRICAHLAGPPTAQVSWAGWHRRAGVAAGWCHAESPPCNGPGTASLRPGFEHQVEGGLGRAAETGEAAAADDHLLQLRLARLGAEGGAAMGQRCRDADHR